MAGDGVRSRIEEEAERELATVRRIAPRASAARAPGAEAESQRPDRMRDGGGQMRPAVSFTRADAVEFKATDWLIDDWLVNNTLAGLVGPSGSCKSFLAVDWSCRIATGAPWFGREVKQGAVFYLAGEGRQGLRKRILAWESHNQQSISGAPLYLADGLPFLCDDLNAAGVVDAIAAVTAGAAHETGHTPRLIVVDTVARAMSGANENAAEDMGRFVKALDWLRNEWGACVLALHHTGNDPGAQDRGRGSSALRAALDSEFIVKPGDPSFSVSVSKAKDWATPQPLWLRRVPIDIPVPRLDADDADPRPKAIPERSLVLVDEAGARDEESKRELVLRMASEGRKPIEIVRETGFPRSSVYHWLKPKGPAS